MTYKAGSPSPSWRELRIAAFSDEPDSRGGPPREGFKRSVVTTWPCGFVPTEQSVIAWLRRCLQEWEIHESDEWLRLDGEIVHDPHECHQCRIQGCRA